MPRKSGSGKRRYKGFRKLKFQNAVPLGTLAADDVVSSAISQVLTEERRILSMETTVSLQDLTSGDGPVVVGIAHSDYDNAEIEECLESFAAWDEGDLVAQEQSKRLVRTIGIVSELEPTLNEGRPVKIRLNWRIASGDSFRLWIMNRGGAPTTGALVKFDGHFNSVLV